MSHKDGAVRLNRLNRAGALLFNHDRNAHIGRVVSAGVDGKKLNVTVKFGNSPLAKEQAWAHASEQEKLSEDGSGANHAERAKGSGETANSASSTLQSIDAAMSQTKEKE